MQLVLRPVRLPLPPARPRSSETDGSVSGRSSGAREHVSDSSAPLGAGKGKLLVHSGLPLPAPLPRLPLPAHHSTLCDVVSRESLRWSAPVLGPPVFPDLRIEEQRRIVEPTLSRPALVTGPVVLALALLTARGQAVESVGGGTRLGRCPPVCGHGVAGLRIDTGLAETAFDVTSRGLLTATGCVDSVRVPLLVGEVAVTSRARIPPRHPRDRSRSRARSPPSSDRSRSKEGGQRARREQQERVETVAVSQAPAVSGASAAVVPPVGGATMAALLSAVQDLARFFLNLAGSSSLGAVGGVAGVVAPASGVGVQLCPLAPGGGAVAPCAATAIPAGVVDPPDAPAAVPGLSGLQQHQGISRPSRRRRRSSSDGNGRAQKKRPRGRSPSPGRSSRYREGSYRSSSDSSEDDRAKTSPPMAGRAPGGTPGDSRPAPKGDRSSHPGPSGWRPWSSAGAEQYCSGFGGRLSPVSSGEETDNDRSSAFDALDIDQDDSFWSVLALIWNFHSMEEPAGVPAARCKTSLASIYGLMSESFPAFHLPTSPLVRSLLDGTNLALSKFLEDQTVHGFLPVPSRRH